MVVVATPVSTVLRRARTRKGTRAVQVRRACAGASVAGSGAVGGTGPLAADPVPVPVAVISVSASIPISISIAVSDSVSVSVPVAHAVYELKELGATLYCGFEIYCLQFFVTENNFYCYSV